MQLGVERQILKSAFSTSVFTGGESSISSRREKAGSENRPERSEHAAGLLTSSGLFSLTFSAWFVSIGLGLVIANVGLETCSRWFVGVS